MRIVRLSSLSDSHLAIDSDTFVVDDVLDGDFEMTVNANTKLLYASAEIGASEATRLVRLVWAGASATVRAVFSVTDAKIKRRMETRMEASDTIADIRLLSLVRDTGEVDLDGSLMIAEGVKNAEGKLAEDNVFLGTGGKIRGLPTLIVHSDEVRASHAMRVERISDERMFYLRSHGMSPEESRALLAGGAIRAIFAPMRDADTTCYEELLSKFSLSHE